MSLASRAILWRQKERATSLFYDDLAERDFLYSLDYRRPGAVHPIHAYTIATMSLAIPPPVLARLLCLPIRLLFATNPIKDEASRSIEYCEDSASRLLANDLH